MNKHRKAASQSSVFIGRSAMHNAMAMRDTNEFDRAVAISLALLFNDRSHAIGKGLVLELFDASLGKKNKQNLMDQSINLCEMVAGIAVAQFPPKHANTLWNAVPPNRKLEMLTAMLGLALIDEDHGWIRVTRDEIEHLRIRNKRHASNQRIGQLCAEVVNDLKRFFGDHIPKGPVSSPAWQRCLGWMIERLIEAGYEISDAQKLPPDDNMLVPAEWLAKSLEQLPRSQTFTLDRACDLGRLDAYDYPTLGRISSEVRRVHLGETTQLTLEGKKRVARTMRAVGAYEDRPQL